MSTEGTLDYSREYELPHPRAIHMGNHRRVAGRLLRLSKYLLCGGGLGLLVGCTTTVAVQDDEKTCTSIRKSELDYSQIRPIVEDIVGAATRRAEQQRRAAAVDLAAACAGKSQCVVLVDGQCYAVSSQ